MRSLTYAACLTLGALCALSTEVASANDGASVLRIGGLVGYTHDASCEDDSGGEWSWVAQGLNLFRDKLCGQDTSEGCFNLTDSSGQVYAFDLELKWENVAQAPEGNITLHTTRADVAEGWAKLHADAPVHALVSTVNAGAFTVDDAVADAGTPLPLALQHPAGWDATHAEDLSLPLLHPLSGGDGSFRNALWGSGRAGFPGGELPHSFFLAYSPSQHARAVLKALMDAGVSKLGLISAFPYNTEQCDALIDLAPSYGIDVASHVELGYPNHTMSDGSTYIGSDGPGAGLHGVDAFTILRRERVDSAYACAGSLSNSWRDPFTIMVENHLGGNMSVAFGSGFQYEGGYTSYTPATRPTISLVQQLDILTDPVPATLNLPWSQHYMSHAADLLGSTSSLIPSWRDFRTWATDQRDYNTENDPRNNGPDGQVWSRILPQWGNAAGAAAGEVYVSAFMEAFEGCDISPSNGDVNEMLENPDAILCPPDGTPRLGKDRWLAAIQATDIMTVLGPVAFPSGDEIEPDTPPAATYAVNVPGRHAPVLQAQQNGEYDLEQETYHIHAYVVLPDGMRDNMGPGAPGLCMRGLPDCPTFRPDDVVGAPGPNDEGEGEGEGQGAAPMPADDPTGNDLSTKSLLAIAIGCAVGGMLFIIMTIQVRKRVRSRRLKTYVDDDMVLASASSSADRRKTEESVKMAHDDGVFSTKLGPFLGGGSFGNVYAGRWKKTLVAVKTMRTANAMEARAIVDEITLHSALRHPNIVHTYEWGRRHAGDAGCGVQEFWMIMELCYHGSLHDVIEAGVFLDEERKTSEGKPLCCERKVLIAAQQVAAGCLYLHTTGVLHGDLKPHNVLVTSTMRKHRPSRPSTIRTSDLHPHVVDRAMEPVAAAAGSATPRQSRRSLTASAVAANGGTAMGHDVHVVMKEAALGAAGKQGIPSRDCSADSRAISSGSTSGNVLGGAGGETPAKSGARSKLTWSLNSSGAFSRLRGGAPASEEARAVPAPGGRASRGSNPSKAERSWESVDAELAFTRPSLKELEVGSAIFKLGDFGLSRALAHEGTHLSHAQAGTIAYAAPEVLDEHKYGRPADVYSFGSLLFEMAAQRTVHGEATLLEVLRRVAAGFVPDQKVLQQVPKFIADATVACMAPNPQDRPDFATIYDILSARLKALDCNDGIGSSWDTLLAATIATNESPLAVQDGTSAIDNIKWYDQCLSVEMLDALADAQLNEITNEQLKAKGAPGL